MLGTSGDNKTGGRWRHVCRVPKGFLPLVVYAGAFVLPPLLFDSGVTCFPTGGWGSKAGNATMPIAMHDYLHYDYENVNTQVAHIVLPVVFSAILILANDCRTWFNCVLFFHIGVETKTVDVLLTYIRDPLTSTAHVALSVTAVVVIVAHLVPFLVVSWRHTLVALAFVGVQINVATLVFLDPSRLLLVGASSTLLLLTTLSIRCVCHINTSILSALVEAMYLGTWIVYAPYHLVTERQCGYVYHEVYHDSARVKEVGNTCDVVECDRIDDDNKPQPVDDDRASSAKPPQVSHVELARRYTSSSSTYHGNASRTRSVDATILRQGPGSAEHNHSAILRRQGREDFADEQRHRDRTVHVTPRRSSSVPPLARHAQRAGPVIHHSHTGRAPRI